MKNSKEKKLHQYFIEWVQMYKVGAIRDTTLEKYYISHWRWHGHRFSVDDAVGG